MAKILINHWNNVLYDVYDKLVERGHKVITDPKYLKNPKGIDVGVFWNETDTGKREGWKSWRDYIMNFKDKGIRTILIQHGRRGTSRIYPPFNEKLISDVVCVWGEGDKKRLISVGTPADRIVVTGTPIFRSLKPRVKQEKPTIVYCPEHWQIGEVDENLCVAGELRKLEGVNIITKLLEGEHETSWYDNPVISNRRKTEHLEIVADVLSKADVIVSLVDGTFELLAEYLDIPVVLADIWVPKACGGDERYREYNRIYSNACRKVKFKEINNAVRYALKHPEHLRAERKKISIEDGSVNIKDPTMEIIKIIENV
jgi:hypothetical protein